MGLRLLSDKTGQYCLLLVVIKKASCSVYFVMYRFVFSMTTLYYTYTGVLTVW